MAKDTPFVNELLNELKNEIPKDYAINRHAPLKTQIDQANRKP